MEVRITKAGWLVYHLTGSAAYWSRNREAIKREIRIKRLVLVSDESREGIAEREAQEARERELVAA